jgi:DNA repair ATPase RecN
MLEEKFYEAHNTRKGVTTMSENLTQPLPNGGVQLILASLENLNGRMTTLEDKVDQRLQETRPIWEQVLSRLDRIEVRLDSIEARLDSIEARLDKIEARLDKVESEIYSIKRKFRVFLDEFIKVEDRQEELEERVTRLEPGSTP